MGIIDGKKIASLIKEEIKQEVKNMMAQGLKRPHLAAVLVGHDGGSETYVAAKIKACAECGFESTLVRHEDNVTERQLLETIDRLNNNPEVDGFIVQLPLPRHINEQRIIEAIDYRKDVDGFHPVNVGRMSLGLPCFKSATPLGIITLLDKCGIETSGKHCVVVGRSNIVGKPIASMLMLKAQPGNCTVTVCHSATVGIENYTRQADILITAMGSPGFIKADMVKPGVTIIDVGITRTVSTETRSGYKLRGDVDYDNVAPLCSHITPVPGGVGPMTIVSLMKNTLLAAQHAIFK